MQAKLVSALDTLFYFKHRQLLREGFEKIFEASLPQQAPLNFSLVSVVQYYPHGNKILRDPDVLATLTKLFTVTNDVSGLQNEAIQEVLINVVGEFARLEGELVRLRRKDKPKPALHLLSESEYQILMDHKYQLEQNIESLDKQVNFLREAKKKTEDKFRDQIDKQTQQLARLNEELEQATREKNESVTALTEKDTKLQSTLVLLSSAQEEIRHLLQEKSQSKLKDKQDAAEINDMIQRHSKYSAAQFTQLSAQLDAVRLELKKEKAERLREREDSSRDNNQLKKKLEVTEAMLDSVNKRFSDVAAVGLHNYNVQTGTAIDIPSIARKELSNQHHDEVLSLRSESRGDPRDEGDDRDPEQRMRKDPLRSLPHHQSRSRSSSRPKARYYQQVEGKRPEQRPYSHEGPVKSLRDRSVQRALQAEDNRRRSRSESPAFRGKHIMYQPAAIQTPFSHGQPLAQHPLRSSLGNNIEDLAQRLVYSQETSVLSPNSKRKQLSGADSTLLSHDFANGDHQLRQQHPHGDQASITAVTGGSSVVDTDSSTAGVGDGGARAANNNGGAAVQALLSDHESDALSSIPRPDGEDDEDDDHVLVFDGQHGHPYQTSGGLALNTSPKTLSHRTGGERGAPSTVSTQRMTEYLYDAERYEPGLAHQPTTPQGAPFHHPDFPLLNALNQPAASASPDRHPSSSARQSTSSAVGSASFAVSSSLPSSPHRSPRTSMDHHPRETEKALMSPLTSPSPQQNSPPWRKHQQQQHAHGIKSEMAVQTERSDHLMEHMRGGSYSSPVTGQHKTVGSTHTAPFTVAEQPADIALKFTRIVPPAFTPKELALPDAAAIHRSYSDHAEHPTPSLMARGDGRSTIDALRAQYGANSGGDGDETVVSMNTATIHHPNHTSGPEANEGKSTWNILFQKKEYLSMDAPQTSSASQLPPSTSAAEKNVYIAKSLFQQVLDVYNQTIDDYNALLRAHREEYAEHERIKSDFKEEIYESVAKIHDLQTKLHALSLENDHLQSVLNKRGLDGMTVISQPDESVLLHQQQLLLNQQTQEMLQQMQSRWLESEQKVADLVAQAAAQQQQQQLDALADAADATASAAAAAAAAAATSTANAMEYALGLDRSTHELPVLIKLFEDNCQLLTNLPSEKITVSKLFVWDLLHVLNNIQHHWLRQMHHTQTNAEGVDKRNAQLQREVDQLTKQHREQEQAYQQLQLQHQQLQRQQTETSDALQQQQRVQVDWQVQHERLQQQLQSLQAQLLTQEQEHESLLQQRLQQEYDAWQQKHQPHRHGHGHGHGHGHDEQLVEDASVHTQQLRSLHEQLEQTRQALEEMKETQQAEARRQQQQQQQQDEGHDEQSLLKLLLDSSKHHALGSDHSRMSRTQKKLSSSLLLPTNDAHYQEDLQYISDMKSRLDHLHQLLAKDPKYRQYVTSPSDEGDHGRGDDEGEEPEEHEGDDDDDAAGDAEAKAQMEAEQMQYLMVAKVELEDRLIRAEARVQLLTQQLESMPPSLTVAQAEKRVLEAKLSKAIEAHDFNMQKLQANAVTKIQEINAFLDLERQEKEQLQEQLRDAQATIHRLTHHLKMLQAAHETRGTREALLQAGHTGATAHHHTATPRMSTATALDILKQPSPLVSYSTTGATSVREAALSTLGLSLGTPAPWEAGAVPRTHQQSSVPAPSAAVHSAGGGEHSSAHATGSAPPSRRVTPTRSRPGSAKPSPSKSPSSSATSHRHRAQANDHNHHHPSAHAHAGSPNATSRKASRAATSEPFLGRAQQTPHQTVNSSFTQPLFHR